MHFNLTSFCDIIFCFFLCYFNWTSFSRHYFGFFFIIFLNNPILNICKTEFSIIWSTSGYRILAKYYFLSLMVLDIAFALIDYDTKRKDKLLIKKFLIAHTREYAGVSIIRSTSRHRISTNYFCSIMNDLTIRCRTKHRKFLVTRTYEKSSIVYLFNLDLVLIFASRTLQTSIT